MLKTSVILLLIQILNYGCHDRNIKHSQILYNSIVNIGDVKLGDTISIKSYIKNISNNNLNIEAIKSSCNCAVIDIENYLINPNDSIFLKIKILIEKTESNIIDQKVVFKIKSEPGFKIIRLKGVINN